MYRAKGVGLAAPQIGKNIDYLLLMEALSQEEGKMTIQEHWE